MKRDKCNLKICALLGMLLVSLNLIFIFPSVGTIPPYPCYGFGSKVAFSDGDNGRPLSFISCPLFGFIDLGKEKSIYDESDPVYLDMNKDNNISINDIRITPFRGYISGSKVARTDIEINAPLVHFRNWTIAYVDSDGNGIYSLQDSLYLHNWARGDQIVSGDIRLTSFDGFLPGMRVVNSNPDANLSAFDLMPINHSRKIHNVVAIRFFNANGNYHYQIGSPLYDRPDDVYLHIIAPYNELGAGTMGLVGPNDLRLSL